MAPTPASPAPFPGAFPHSSRSPPHSSPPQPTPTTNPLSFNETTKRGGVASRGRRTSSSIQAHRPAAPLGLGVAFAPMVASETSSSRPSSASPTSSSPPSSDLRKSPRSPSPPALQSRRQSRRSSWNPLVQQAAVSQPAAAAAEKPANAGATSGTRSAPRRPSLSHLASFLSGIEHHTRVRNPAAGRGVSRSASRSHSRAGEGRRARRSGGESSSGDTSDDDDPSEGGSRASSVAARSRRSSLSLSMTRGNSGGSGSPHPYLHSLVRDNTTGALSARAAGARSAESLWAEDNDEDRHDDEARDEMTQERSQSGWQRTWRPLPTPRVLSTEMEEEPFLDTAPNSPQPKRTRTSDSYVHAGTSANDLQEVDVFEEGERVGVDVWLEGRGGWVRDCFADSSEGGPGNGIGGPRELEVEKRLGEGTYAIVYLVREVLFDPDVNDDDILSPIDAFTSFQFDSPLSAAHSPGKNGRPSMHSWASEPFSPSQVTTYGRNFALKCLCKKDLTDELIEVQRGEAVLHRALPDHEYIVRLYGAYETDDWLFLVLEYCPGRDLFYWLLESQEVGSDAMYDARRSSPAGFKNRRSIDLGDEDEHLSRTITADNPMPDFVDETPPSPSLLASAGAQNNSLMTRKRLRLISRMFTQMCEAVQACHAVGIAHRDIKPENFIVVDGRADGESGSSRAIVVKITDWGLGTREELCEDFDCGSKPYMSYECRNNLSPTYDPRQADVWSLGLVLLNLLYHRNPWADPSLDDPDFAEYVQDPRGFLLNRFEGMPGSVADFLAEKVFCDVLDKDADGVPKHRVSAGEFGKWASRLVLMMSDDSFAKRNTVQDAPSPSETIFEITSPMLRSPLAGNPAATASLLSQFAPSSSASKPWSPQLLDDLQQQQEELPVVKEVKEERLYATNPSTPSGRFSDDESLPSPSFSPPVQAAKLPSPTGAQVTTLPWEIESSTSGLNTDRAGHQIERGASPPFAMSPPLLPSPPALDQSAPQSPKRSALPAEADHISAKPVANAVSGVTAYAVDETRTAEVEPDKDHEEKRDGLEEGDSHNPKSKRRKRGARKSKHPRHHTEHSPPTPSPLSPASPVTLSPVDEHKDQILQDLASASQNLARELSKAPKSYSNTSKPSLSGRGSSTSRPSTSVSLETRSMSAVRTVSPPAVEDKKAAKAGGVFGRFRNLVADGNPDLEAFKQRAAERNASIGAASAPAKMEGRKKHESTPLSSRGSYGTASRGSNWSGHDGGDERSRGRVNGGEMSPDHWSTTSSRRERLDKQRRRGESDFSPSSSVRTGGGANTISTSTMDSRTNTPLTSFSSVHSNDATMSSHTLPASIGPSSRDWRSQSPNRAAGGVASSGPSVSRTRHPRGPPSSGSVLGPALPVTSKGTPKLVDVAVDTTDLCVAVPKSPAPSTTSTIAAPRPARPAPTTAASDKTVKLAGAVVEPPPHTPSPNIAAPVPAAIKTNKLAKMLNSISVFNRTQEKPAPP